MDETDIIYVDDGIIKRKLIEFKKCLKEEENSICYMNLERGKWKCNQCGETGNQLDLLMDIKNPSAMFCPCCKSNNWKWIN